MKFIKENGMVIEEEKDGAAFDLELIGQFGVIPLFFGFCMLMLALIIPPLAFLLIPVGIIGAIVLAVKRNMRSLK